MERNQRKNLNLDHGNTTGKVTYTKQTRVVIDEAGLRRALTAKVYDKFTTRVLDRKAMEKAMEAGEINPVTVAKFIKIVESAPFIKYTESENDHLG